MKQAALSVFLAIGFAVTGLVGFDVLQSGEKTGAFAADANAKQKSGSMSGTKAGQRTCTAKTNAGETKTWQCPANQACCINRFMDQYVCGIPGLGCI
ncbi:MAG TPA: hypothetical protein PLW75_09440 [Hyphomicrobium sp.]|nr:hypothetical protein [Hyphomicrobium sp.]